MSTPVPAPPANPAFSFPDAKPYVYQTLDGTDYPLDIYLPTSASSGSIPALIYFHGGGLVMGNRSINTWAPKWLIADALEAGIAVIMVTYTFLSPQSGLDILRDIQACFKHIGGSLNSELAKTTSVKIDSRRLAVSGSSAGGWMSYMSGLHMNPKPKAIVSIYGMAANMLTPFYLDVKTKPFMWLTPVLLADADFLPILKTPATERLTSTPLESPRLDYYTWLLQKGLFIDVLTDQPGLTAHLRGLPESARAAAIPAHARPMFPHINVKSNFPPTFFLHGTDDEAVPIDESRVMLKACEDAGVKSCRMLEIEGGNHDFDYEKESKDVEGLAEVVPWLLKQLG
ncbi:hypothetical protein RQP46_002835 [Phenoliferia psychrophenolica]